MREWGRGSDPWQWKDANFNLYESGGGRLCAWLALNEAVCLPKWVLPTLNHSVSLLSSPHSPLSHLHHACVIIMLQHRRSVSAGPCLTPLCHQSWVVIQHNASRGNRWQLQHVCPLWHVGQSKAGDMKRKERHGAENWMKWFHCHHIYHYCKENQRHWPALDVLDHDFLL